MRITTRLTVSLFIAVAAVAAFFAHLQVSQDRARLETELLHRAGLLADSLQDNVQPLLIWNARAQLERLAERFSNRERLRGTAVYDAAGRLVAASKSLAPALASPPRVLSRPGPTASEFDKVGGKPTHLFALRMGTPEKPLGSLILFQDAGHVKSELADVWRRAFFRVLAQTLLIILVTLLVVRWSVEGPVVQMAEWMKRLRAGEELPRLTLPKVDVLAPLAREVDTFAQHLSRARSAAEEEARLRRASEALWTPEKLKEVLRARLSGRQLVVVSNREPYLHQRHGRKIDCIIPAGGLVTALDPVMRAADGLWIAHGSGDADWEVVDDKNRIRVPPQDPHYTLKRVALTPAQEQGYYYGFANEGLWPLCHIAHARPVFRPSDWEQYQAVNAKFAEEVLDELQRGPDPLVLIQDYHFALLPRMIKKRRPDARIALFWHIPWPNPEAFGICPWQKEILYGMLGADLIGFHTQYHCNNFLETVDRTLESRIEWERFTVMKEERATLIKPFPISVDFNGAPSTPLPEKEALFKELGVRADLLLVGVDRIDYTKGLIERFQAVEHLLEKRPEYRGRLTLVQIGAPSRTPIKRYADFMAEVEQEAERINWKYKSKAWRPIVLLKRHHNPEEIRPFYRRADACLVTSLHDGMNLVAKEFVAARDDGDGVLVLSRFAGAARELQDALIVNPYDLEQTAEAIHVALTMEPEDRRDRMARMRDNVRENNIYRWAGDLVMELSQIPVSHAGAHP